MVENFDIVKLIYDSLSPLGVPVSYGWYNEKYKDTHISFFVLMELPEAFSEDEEEISSIHIQVDLWSLEDSNLNRKIKSVLKKAGFYFSESKNDFETDTLIYHKAMRFKYYLQEVEE